MPGWRWEAKSKTGKRQTGWTSGSSLRNPKMLLAHLILHYRNLDYSEFKCERQDSRPLIVTPVPGSWCEFGTTRMRMEIDAGLRPNSSVLQPPLEFTNDRPVPTNQKIIVPTWRKRS